MTAASDPTRYVLRLFVSGSTARSLRAIANIRRIAEQHLSGRYQLEVIDVYENAEATREWQIIATPSLVRESPIPLRRIIGDLSDTLQVLKGLDLDLVSPDSSTEPLR